MCGAGSRARASTLAFIAAGLTLALPGTRAYAFVPAAFDMTRQPPVPSADAVDGPVDGAYPTVLLPLEVRRQIGDPNDTTLPFGDYDLAFNSRAKTDLRGDVVIRGGYLSPGIRTYRRSLTRGYVPVPGLRSTLRTEADSSFTEVEVGTAIEFHYDVNGRLEKIVDPNGRTITVTRDGAGKATQVSDGSGRSITLTYSATLITQAAFSAGGVIAYEYTPCQACGTGGASRISKITNLVGEVSTFTYNDSGQLISSTDPVVGTLTHEINNSPLRVTIKDSDGVVISTMDINTDSRSGASTNVLGLTTTSNQDYRGLDVSETTSMGRRTVTEYDAERNPIRVVTNTDTVVMRYADFGLMTSRSHALGETVTYAYDTANRRLVQVALPGGLAETYAYDTRGNVITYKAPNGGVFSFTYDSAGNRTRIVDPDGVATDFEYNAAGFVTARKSCASCGGGGATTQVFEYNAYGYLISQGNGFDTVTITPDEHGRGLVVTLPGGGKSTTIWSAAGPASIANSILGETVTYAYNQGRLIAMTDALGARTEFTHLGSSDLATYKSPIGDVTSYGYDSAANLGKVTWPTNPLGTPVRTYTSDSEDRVVKYVRETGDVIEYEYDSMGRFIQREANSSAVATLTYDTRGYLATASEPLGMTTYTRDALGNATSISHPNGTTMNYAYSPAGRLTRISTIGYSSDIAYDSRGALASVGTQAGAIVFEYDSAGRVSTMTYPNGVVAVYTYGPTGATSRMEYRNVGGDTIVFTIDRDSIVRITQTFRSDLNETMTLTYSPRGEVIGARIRRASDTLAFAYTYDSAGNRTRYAANGETTNYQYDAGNLLDTGGVDYSYNLAGEVTAIGPRSMTYTAEGMLRTDTTPQGTITYDYDAFGRRQRSVVGETTVWRLWDEAQNEIADADASGNIKEFRYFVPGQMDGFLGFTRGTQTFFSLIDPAGNIALVVNETGAIVARHAYEPFQARAGDGSDSIENLFRFASRRMELSGEIFIRARSLDAQGGRFHQRDPIFIGNGVSPFSWNGFLYGDNDPVNNSDPTGMDCVYGAPRTSVTIIKKGLDYIGRFPGRLCEYTDIWSSHSILRIFVTVERVVSRDSGDDCRDRVTSRTEYSTGGRLPVPGTDYGCRQRFMGRP